MQSLAVAREPAGRPLVDRAVLAALVLGCAASLWVRLDFGLVINDEGWLLHPVLRMLGGEVLYRDVWVHYAPLRYHLLEALFRVTGPSLLAERGLLAGMMVLSAAGSYAIARRAAPAWLAWIPGAVYVLVPGPWHKAPYALSSVACLLAMARGLERPTSARLAGWGAAIGATLLMRHDLGLFFGALSIVAVGLWPRADATAPRGRALLWIGGSALAVVVPMAAWYAAQGALGEALNALFVRAFAQYGGSPVEPLLALLQGRTVEGPVAAAALLVAPALYAAVGVWWLAGLRRRGLDPRGLVCGAVWLTGMASLPQLYVPPLIARLLQSALPLYLGTVWLLAASSRRVGWGLALGAGLLVGSVHVYGVVAGIPRAVPKPEYTGTWQPGARTLPIEMLGDEIRVRERMAEEIRLLRGFIGSRTHPAEPIFAWPWQSLYYVLLERPNPTRILFERLRAGDWALDAGMKHAELERLLASQTRYALVWTLWWLEVAPDDAIGRGLGQSFVPIRRYGELLVLERSDDATRLVLSGMLRSVEARGWSRARERGWRRYAGAFPGEPLPQVLLAEAALARGDLAAAAARVERALELDPVDPWPLERLAQAQLARGDLAAAAVSVERARRVHDRPSLKRLAERIRASALGGALGEPGPRVYSPR